MAFDPSTAVWETDVAEPARFDTPLSSSEEKDYQEWKGRVAPNDSGQDYDFRGAFKQGVTPSENGHWPDTFKKPNHPTFSDESIYAKDAQQKAGHWSGETFIPAKSKFDPSTAEWETGKFDPSTAVLEHDEGLTAEQRDAVADGIADSISATTGAPKFVTKLLLTKGGKPGDIAANIIFPMAGSAIGGITGGPGGAVAGGMAGGAAGDTVSQAREMLRGEREDFSLGELAGSTVVSGFTPAKVAGGVAKTVLVRGAQGAGLGGAQETIKELIDKDELDLGQILEAGAWGAGFGAAFGGLEKGIPALWNRIRKESPKQALETLASEPKTPEVVALEAEIQQRDMSPETAARNELNAKLQQPVKVQAMGPDGPVEVQLPASEALKRVEAQAKTETDAIYKQAGVEPPKPPEVTQTPIEAQTAPETTGTGNADALPPAEMPMSAEPEPTIREDPVADYQRNLQIEKRFRELAAEGKINSPEYNAIHEEQIAIKNRNSSDPGMPPEAPPQAVDSAFKAALTSAREKIEDSNIRVKKLLAQDGVIVTDESNIYQKMTAMPGKLGQAIDRENAFAEGFAYEVKQTAKDAGQKTKAVASDVNAYLQARHAPERNAKLGDGAAGMTDAQAADVIAQINASPQGAKVRALADQVQDFHNQTLDVMLEGQLITPELYASLRKQYPNHVPLNRILPDTEDIGAVLGGRGLDVKSSGLKKALGSDLPVDDIVGNVLTNYEQAAIRAAKNEVDLSTLKFARENPQLDLFEIVNRTPIGKSFDGEKIILAEMTDPQVLTMREKGKPVYLRIKDPLLAPAIRGINRAELPSWMRFVAGFTRLYSGLQTFYNLEFGPPNKLRDLQEAVVYMGAQKEIGAGGAIKTAVKDVASVKDVWDGVRGKDTPGTRLYQQLKDDGGTTGGMALSTRQKVREDMDKLWKRVDSPTRQAGHAALKLIDNWNTIFEDSTRLSIYKRALDAGASRERAAFMAKEGTIDFNRMGTAGPIVNSLYMFSNASIQGSAKMLRSMRNPKVAAAVITAVGGAVAVTNQWNNEIDPDWKKKISKWDRINSLPVVLPPKEGSTEFRYLAIPVSWGLKPIKVGADQVGDLLEGDATAGGAVLGVAQAIVEGYNPVGGTDLTQAITPTILDLAVDLGRNKKWSGAPIKPDFDPNAPESVKFFSNEKKSFVGRGLIASTRELSKASEGRIEISPADLHYSLETLVGGAGRLAGKVTNTSVALAKGKLPDAIDVPITSRVYRSIPADRLGGGKDPLLDKALTEQARGRFYEREQAQDFIDGLAKLPPEQKQAKLNALTDEEYDRVERAALKKAMPFEVSRMKQLGVENGARAIYLADKIQKMPMADRAAFYESLVEDGVISENVEEQLDALLSAKK